MAEQIDFNDPEIISLLGENHSDFHQFWKLPDGQVCGLSRLIYHWTVKIDLSEIGYRDRYCFPTSDLAITAMEQWNGEGDPINWHRHPRTGRRRPDYTPASEYIEF